MPKAIVAAGLLAFALGFGRHADAQTVPTGDELQLRFRQLVSSHTTKAGETIRAQIISPALVDAEIVIPLASEVIGTVTGVRRVGLGFARERAYLEITFDRIRLPDGQELPATIRIVSIDDSREAVDATGRINGIRASATFASSIAGFAISVGSVDPMLLGFTTASSLSAFRIPESEIVFPAGTEFRARLEAPLTVIPTTGAESGAAPRKPAEITLDDGQRTALTTLVRGLPYRTATDVTQIPSDVTNLLFLGSREAVETAFDAAGWSQTDALGGRSTYRVLRAIVENQGYREAPMSTLVLGDRRPAFTYAKTLNTFFKRHHLRIFGEMGRYDGQAVWTASSTHDSGIGFGTRRKTFIHVIDENIDEERDKVVNDLLLTQCVEGVTHIDRPWLPDDLSNSTGDTLRTDKRVAVIRLNACTHPARADEDVTRDDTEKPVDGRGRLVGRGLRDAVLSAKDSFWRGNLFYQGYSATKMAVGALRGRHEEKPAERQMQIGGEEFKIVPGADAPRHELAPKDVDEDARPSFDQVQVPRSYDPRLIFSFSGSGSNLAGGSNGATMLADYRVDSGEAGALTVPLRLTTTLRAEAGFALRATLRSWTHVSQEFAFSQTNMVMTASGTTDIVDPNELSAGGKLRQFNYNVLLSPRPRGRRLRPYAAVGPVVQLIRLDESAARSNRFVRVAFKNVGLLASAWNFGHTPPLEGGGIFQLGVQYGGGVKYNLTPSLVLRSDFRETLIPQPDFLTKSTPRFVEAGVTPTGYDAGPPLRLRQFSIGLGIGF